jgi:hydrogenase 3 maturation protease
MSQINYSGEISLTQELVARLNKLLSVPVAFIGLGNELRSDDCFGVELAKRLKGKIPAEVMITFDVPENYIKHMIDSHAEKFILLDTVFIDNYDDGKDKLLFDKRFVLIDSSQFRNLSVSTHSNSLNLVVDFVTNHKKTAKFYLLGFVPEKLNVAEGPSGIVEKAISFMEHFLINYYQNFGGKN